MSTVLNITGAAALGIRLTGAGSAGGGQVAPLQSIGGFPSSSRVMSLMPSRPAGLYGIWIEHVSGANGTGVGTLSVVSDTQMTWAAPGEAPGDPVTIAGGESAVLFSETGSKYVIVSRATGSTFRGSEAVGLIEVFNNWLGGSNFSMAETAAGADKHLAIVFTNDAESGNITNLKVWTDGTLPGVVAIGSDALVSGAIQTVADEDTAPTAVTYSTPTTSGGALSIGTLAPGAGYGLWRERSVAIDADASALVRTRLYVSFTYGGENYTEEIRGLNRIANANAQGYELHHAEGEDPDIDGTPVATGASSPLTWTSTLAEGEHRFALVYRNEYGVASVAADGLNTGTIWIDALGDEYTAPPNAPQSFTAEATTDGAIAWTGLYHPNTEGTTLVGIRAKRANKWAVYAEIGVDPDPTTDTPTLVDMTCTDPANDLEAVVRAREAWIANTAEYLDGTPVHVLIRTHRDDGVLDPVESTNLTAIVVEAKTTGPARPRGYATIGGAYGVAQAAQSADSGTYWIDQPNNIRIEYEAGTASLYGDSVLVWRAIWDGRDSGRSGWYMSDDWSYETATVSGAGTTDPIEVASWGVTKVLYVNVNSVRRMKIDFDAKVITFLEYQDVEIASPQYDEPILPRYAETVFLVYDVSFERYESYLSVLSTGVIKRGLRTDWGMLTQAEIEAL